MQRATPQRLRQLIDTQLIDTQLIDTQLIDTMLAARDLHHLCNAHRAVAA